MNRLNSSTFEMSASFFPPRRGDSGVRGLSLMRLNAFELISHMISFCSCDGIHATIYIKSVKLDKLHGTD